MLTDAWWRKNRETSWAMTTADQAARLFHDPVSSAQARFRCPVCSRYLAFRPDSDGRTPCFFHEDPEMNAACERKYTEQKKKESSLSHTTRYRIRQDGQTFHLDLGLPPVDADVLKSALDSRLQFRIQGNSGNFERYNLQDLSYEAGQTLWLPLPDDWSSFRLFSMPESACPMPWIPAPQMPEAMLLFDISTGETLEDQKNLYLHEPCLILVTKPRFVPPEGIELVRCSEAQNKLYLFRLTVTAFSEKTAAYLERQFSLTLRRYNQAAAEEIVWPPVPAETEDSLTTSAGSLWFHLACYNTVKGVPGRYAETQTRLETGPGTSLVLVKRRKKLETLIFRGPETEKKLHLRPEEEPAPVVPGLSLTDAAGTPLPEKDYFLDMLQDGVLQVLSEVDGKAELSDARGTAASWFLPAGVPVTLTGLNTGLRLVLRQGLDIAQEFITSEEAAARKREKNRIKKEKLKAAKGLKHIKGLKHHKHLKKSNAETQADTQSSPGPSPEADAAYTQDEPAFFYADALPDFMSDDPQWQEEFSRFSQESDQEGGAGPEDNPQQLSMLQPIEEEDAVPEPEPLQPVSSAPSYADIPNAATSPNETDGFSEPVVEAVPPPEPRQRPTRTRPEKPAHAHGPRPGRHMPSPGSAAETDRSGILLPEALWHSRNMSPLPMRYAWVLSALPLSGESRRRLEDSFRSGRIPTPVLYELQKALKSRTSEIR